jgi:hypothetical protein
VAPRHRRTGAGTALLAHCADQARRGRLIGHAYDGSPGAAFAANAGAESGGTDVTRQLQIDSALTSRIKRLRQEAEPHATGYSLVSWRGVTPPDYLDEVVEVHRAMADMPMDQGVEAYAWDADGSTGRRRWQPITACCSTQRPPAMIRPASSPR